MTTECNCCAIIDICVFCFYLKFKSLKRESCELFQDGRLVYLVMLLDDLSVSSFDNLLPDNLSDMIYAITYQDQATGTIYLR